MRAELDNSLDDFARNAIAFAHYDGSKHSTRIGVLIASLHRCGVFPTTCCGDIDIGQMLAR